MKQFLNWKTILTSIASVILIGALTIGKDSIVEAYNDLVKRDDLTAYAKLADVQSLNESIQQLSKEIRSFKKASLMVIGRARVQANSSDECCIRINTAGKAANFSGASEARITNLSNPDAPSTVVSISGTFRNSTADYLAVLSSVAGSRIEANPGEWINVRIEPTEE